MDWLKIISALFIIAMMVMIYPALKNASANAPKGTKQDWLAAVKPLVFVVILVVAPAGVSAGVGAATSASDGFAAALPDGLAKLSLSFCTNEPESSETCFKRRDTRRLHP